MSPKIYRPIKFSKVPPKTSLEIFIKPECKYTSYTGEFNVCENTTYIPYASCNIHLTHNPQCNIGVFNNCDYNAEGDFYIDGKFIGSFRIPKNCTNFQLERSTSSEGPFTYISKFSESSLLPGMNKVPEYEMGGISVRIALKIA